MILHSTSHRTLDYTAREDEPAVGARPLKHYIAIYDPKTRKMEVVEARKMTVRGTVRAKQAPPEALEPPGYMVWLIHPIASRLVVY
jgi:DNA-directed RNA polymerase I subunit RPA49